MLSSELVAALLIVLFVFGVGGLCVLALVGFGALVQKYGGTTPPEGGSEPPLARGATSRPERHPSGSQSPVEPESEKAQDERED